MKRLKTLGSIVAVLLVVSACGVGAYAWRNITYHDRMLRSLQAAGFEETTQQVDGVRLNVGVSPPREGTPVVLLHGQAVAWQQYGYALRDLAKQSQVYAIDVPGHGASDEWADYTAVAVAEALSSYIASIGTPVVLSGHSSGGQLAAIIAAKHPDLVHGVLLEDPPMFSSELPRATETWNWVDLATTAHDYLSVKGTDWQRYQWQNQRMWSFFGDSAEGIIADGNRRLEKKPGEPISLWYMPPAFNEIQEYIVDYDPRFGDAFYTGRWNDGFDQEQVLRSISSPVTYVHCKEVIGEDGILQAATSAAEAQRVLRALGPDAKFIESDSGHNFHGEKRTQFVAEILALRN